MNSWSQPALEGLAEGIKKRDQGMARVLDNPAQDIWREAAYLWLGNLPAGQEVTANDLVSALGIPPSHNAVGAVIRSAATRGLIASTGRYTQNNRPEGHATAIRIWVAT